MLYSLHVHVLYWSGTDESELGPVLIPVWDKSRKFFNLAQNLLNSTYPAHNNWAYMPFNKILLKLKNFNILN